jgi:hypothetical protein
MPLISLSLALDLPTSASDSRTKMSSSDAATIDSPTSEAESQSAKGSSNTAAIAGAVGSGVVLALMLSLVMYIVIRRRCREARPPFVDELGEEGAGEGKTDSDKDRASSRPGGAGSAKPRLVLRERQLGTTWEDDISSADEPPDSKPESASQKPTTANRLCSVFHGLHLQDRLISVSPDNPWTYRNVITVAVSLVLGVAASKIRAIDARPKLSASALVNNSFVHRIREHYPTPQLQHRRTAPIGKTAVSDGSSLCLRFIDFHHWPPTCVQYKR